MRAAIGTSASIAASFDASDDGVGVAAESPPVVSHVAPSRSGTATPRTLIKPSILFNVLSVPRIARSSASDASRAALSAFRSVASSLRSASAALSASRGVFFAKIIKGARAHQIVATSVVIARTRASVVARRGA